MANDISSCAKALSDIAHHPISAVDASDICMPHVGLTRDLTLVRWREEWWAAFRTAKTPEEKLTCERMVNAIGVAIGLNHHQKGAELAEVNRQKLSRKAIEAAEMAAIDRWR